MSGAEGHRLACALCLYDEKHDAAVPAVTLIGGYAVCYDHLECVAQGAEWAILVRAVRTTTG